jgi:hypothetical protein
MLGVSPRQVQRNEKRWGLDRARSALLTRPLLYRASVVTLILINHGALIPALMVRNGT